MIDPNQPVDPKLPRFHSRDDVTLHGNRMQFVGLNGGGAVMAGGEAGKGFVRNGSVVEDLCAGGRFSKRPQIN